jgi:hypothetical protein
MKKLITLVLLVTTMSMADFNAKKYEYHMVNLHEKFVKVQDTNLELYRIFTDNAKYYLESTNKSERDATKVLRCQMRIKLFYGALQASKLDSNE